MVSVYKHNSNNNCVWSSQMFVPAILNLGIVSHVCVCMMSALSQSAIVY